MSYFKQYYEDIGESTQGLLDAYKAGNLESVKNALEELELIKANLDGTDWKDE